MAYAERYFAEFRCQPKRNFGVATAMVRLRFLYEDYSGESSELTVYDPSPITISWADSSPNIFTPIRPKKAQIRLKTLSPQIAESFYVTSDRQVKLIVEQDATGAGTTYSEILFQGWLLPTELNYDYKVPPFELQLSAACGLSTLKERLLLDTAGKRLQGAVSASQILRTALHHSDLTSHLVTGVNLYEESDITIDVTSPDHLANVETDPFYNEIFRAEAFINDKNEPLSCYDAIVKVLAKSMCVITQHEGRWWVMQVPGMVGGFDPWPGGTSTSVRIRQYESANLTAPPGAGSLVKSIDLSGLTAFKTGPLRVLKKNPQLGLTSIKSGIRIEQSFGRLLSKLPGGDFSGAVDGTGLPVGWVVNNIVTTSRFRAGIGTEEDPFRLVILGGADEKINNTAQYVRLTLEYDINSREYTKFLKRTLKGRFRLTNTQAAQVWAVAYRDDGPHLFTEGGWVRLSEIKSEQLVKTRIYHTQKINGVDVAKIGWAEINVDLGTLDRVKAISIFLGMAEALTHPKPNVQEKIEYADVRLEVEQEGLNLTGTQRTIVRDGQSVKDTTLNITLGDVPDAAQPYDHTGTIYKRIALPVYVNTLRWYKPNWGILPNGFPANNGKPKALIDWIALYYAKQVMYPAPTFNGVLVGFLPYGPLSVLRIFDAPELGGALFTRWNWSVRECEHEVTAQRLMADVLDTDLPTTLREWDTPDGTIEMNVDEAGTIVTPAEPKVKSGRQAAEDAINLAIKQTGLRPTIIKRLPGFAPIIPPARPGSKPTLTVLGNGKPLRVIAPTFYKPPSLGKLLIK